jgi:acyl-coenzyme A synthetase/AMP-(fatty) acid ligase
MVMLGNVPPLWETVLALIKLGAVILPATPLLSGGDLADRIERGPVRHIVCAMDCVPSFDHLAQGIRDSSVWCGEHQAGSICDCLRDRRSCRTDPYRSLIVSVRDHRFGQLRI